MPLNGTCLCHSVAVTINTASPPLELCHCTDCRQFTGALAGAFLEVVTADFNLSVEGAELKSYEVTSDAGNTLTRYWCGKCGSSIYLTTSMRKGQRVEVSAGLFPPGYLPQPTSQIWMRSAEPWDKLEGVSAYQKEGDD